jgi:4-carboxymuconolactone decarboxylase
MSNDKREKGRALLEQLCGDADAINSFPDKFLDYSLEHLFGDVWQGDALEFQERELVTCTILTALARESQQKFHFTAARRLKIPREKIVEMIIHTAHYAGWPNAVIALSSLNEVWPDNN